MHVTSRRYYFLIAGLTAVAALGGCAPSQLTVADENATLPKGENSAAFLDRMSSLDTVTQNDAMRGLLMLEGGDKTDTFKQKVDLLIDKKIISPTGSYNASHELSRGQLARMICCACKLSGGLVLRLTGPSERYCLRELQYRKMMIDGSVSAKVSGMEFASVLTRAEIYKRTRRFPDMVGDTD
ncbi:MAG: hypothetical protein QGG42_03540 [Phycisphaerae bacterium]|jgi:hypothetical protein|nr:hypothetical protein [Phycisphaerae bacterium]